jgi:hypothetical protein
MKQIIFNNKKYYVMDETKDHYICEPENNNEGYHWISKNNNIKEV